jgi:hypothetical protein
MIGLGRRDDRAGEVARVTPPCCVKLAAGLAGSYAASSFAM